jgi:hypothetical protein
MSKAEKSRVIAPGSCQRCGMPLTPKDRKGGGEYCNFCMGEK